MVLAKYRIYIQDSATKLVITFHSNFYDFCILPSYLPKKYKNDYSQFSLNWANIHDNIISITIDNIDVILTILTISILYGYQFLPSFH